MNALMKLFPLSAPVKRENAKSLAVSAVIYLAVIIAAGLVLGLLGKLPLIGWVFRLLSWLVRAYCVVGIALAVLKYLSVTE